MIRCIVVLLLARACGLAQMPLPAKVRAGSGILTIDSGFSIRTTGCADARLGAAADRLTARISRQTGIPINPVPGRPATLIVDCQAPAPGYPALNEDESYQLEIAPERAHLTARTSTGALRGLETFAQLITRSSNGFQIPAVQIDDRPRFPWRGLMFDV